MFEDDFLMTIEELKYNRGVPIAEIARELKVSRPTIYKLRNHKMRVTPWMRKKAEIAFPKLLEKYPPLPGSPKFRKELSPFQGKKALEKSVIDAIEKERLRKERILGTFGAKKETKPGEAERIRRERIMGKESGESGKE